jgi:hypothetical protein
VDAAAKSLDLPYRLVQVVRLGHRIGHAVDLPAQVHSNDVGAFGREADPVTTALAAARASNEYSLSRTSSQNSGLFSTDA